jgi:hypothetical protein
MSGTVPVPDETAGAAVVPDVIDAAVAGGKPATDADLKPLDGAATPESVALASGAPAAPTPEEPQQPAFTPHTDTPSLLEQAGKEPPAATTDAPAELVAPVEAAAPTYEPFTLPEGIEAAPEQMAAYAGVLGKYGIPQEAGQDLIALHAAQIQQYAEQTLARQHEAFAEMRAGWRGQVMSDPELGGANHQNAMAAVAEVRDRFIPRSGPVHDAFNDMLTSTGVGDHPAFLRFITRIGQALREPAPPPPAQKPPADIGRRPNGRALTDIYDHPTSQMTAR